MSQAAISTKPARLRLPLPVMGGAVAVILAALLGPGVMRELAVHPVRLHAPNLSLLLRASPLILLHLSSALTALAIGTALLIGVKGGTAHKLLGWTWIAAMVVTAGSSLWITESHPGRWSFIHFFSGWTLIALPMGVAMIKRRNVRAHRRTMTSLFVGGLIVAGAFTFVPGRLMFSVFFG